jgi:hypothetical protein
MESVKSTKKPLGRPATGESREKLTTVVFKADAETRAALDRLVARAQAEGHKRARSAVIRAAILAADSAGPSALSRPR